MALFPAFAEVETKRVEASSKGGKYIFYCTDLYGGIIIYTGRISDELLRVVRDSKACRCCWCCWWYKAMVYFLHSATLPKTFLAQKLF